MPMKTLKSKINFFEELKGLIDSAQNEISIFSPYINSGALTNLLDESSKSVNVAIITTWKPADLALGYSDLKLYPFCEERNIPLLLNKNIHLKAIVIVFLLILGALWTPIFDNFAVIVRYFFRHRLFIDFCIDF